MRDELNLAAKGCFGRFSTQGLMVIYRLEPSPSLTPLLRNYTRSVANKSKKVSMLRWVRYAPLFLSLLSLSISFSLPLSSSLYPSSSPFYSLYRLLIVPLPHISSYPIFLFLLEKRAKLRSQFDRDCGPDSTLRRPRSIEIL